MVFEPALPALDFAKFKKGPELLFTNLTPPKTGAFVDDTCNGRESPDPIDKLNCDL